MTPEEVLAKRVQIVLDEIKVMRLEPSRGPVSTYVVRAFTLTATEQKDLVDRVMEVVGDRPRPKEKKVTEPKGVLRGKELVAAAAHVFREHPDYTAGQVYTSLLEAGHKISMGRSSFQNGYATRARKLLAAGGELPDAPTPTVAREPRSKKAAPPEPEPEPKGRQLLPAATPEGVLAAVENHHPTPVREDREPDREERFVDGDRILAEVGGERLEVRREAGRWAVEFDGHLDDTLVQRLLGRMVTGVAG